MQHARVRSFGGRLHSLLNERQYMSQPTFFRQKAKTYHFHDIEWLTDEHLTHLTEHLHLNNRRNEHG